MKRIVIIVLIFSKSFASSAQSHDVQQLLLNVEKLSQFKKILQNMYDGYKILHKGYTIIKDLSAGNFSLHKTFLDALLQVSPAVKNYQKVKLIVELQISLVKDYKAAFNRFKSDGKFSLAEIDHFAKVYANLFRESVESLDELLIVITAGRLRMNDEERLALIDKIYTDVEEQVSFLREFNSNNLLLSLQRGSEKAEISLSKRLKGF